MRGRQTSRAAPPAILRESRTERRFQLPARVTSAILDELEAHAERVIHLPGNDAVEVATVYFDDELLTLTRQAAENPQNHINARVRVHQTAPEAGGFRVWIEVKHRQGMVSSKLRIPVDLPAAEALLAEGSASPRTADLSALPELAGALEVLDTVRDTRALLPLVRARYRRAEFSLEEGGRITLDTNVVFARAAPGAVARGLADADEEQVLERVEGPVLELKGRDARRQPPEWLLPFIHPKNGVAMGKFRRATAPLLQRQRG